MLRFHPHPSQCRSIGQTIGLTAYPPQRAAIFTMLLLTRTFPAYFRLRALFEASDISTTSEPTVPSGIVSFGPADPVCANHLSCQGLAYSMSEDRSLPSPSYGQNHHIGQGIQERPEETKNRIPVPDFEVLLCKHHHNIKVVTDAASRRHLAPLARTCGCRNSLRGNNGCCIRHMLSHVF